MAEWRFGRGWSDAELTERLAAAAGLGRNFDEPQDQLTPANGWGFHGSEAVVSRERAGPPAPDGPFERAWTLVAGYAFSDPRIVVGHFDGTVPLDGRRMLLEVRVLGLHYLGPVVVGATRHEAGSAHTVRGFRYDTLEGHFERGSEWFVLSKDHRTGDITFAIQASWRRGQLPNAWSRLGFRLVAQRYQRAWHRSAHLRLRRMLGSIGLPPLPPRGRLVHEGRPLVAAAAPPASSPPPAIAESERPERPRASGS